MVTIVEAGPEVMGSLDPDMGAMVARAVRDMGITVQVGAEALAISERAVHTAEGEFPADLIVLGLGVEPNGDLGADAGLETGVRGALVVDRRQRTSAPGVSAAGDCCQSMNLVSGHPVYQALGTVANKQGRGRRYANISGGYASFSRCSRHRRDPGVPPRDRSLGPEPRGGREAAGFSVESARSRRDQHGRLPARGRSDDGQIGGRTRLGSGARRADRRRPGGGEEG